MTADGVILFGPTLLAHNEKGSPPNGSPNGLNGPNLGGKVQVQADFKYFLFIEKVYIIYIYLATL